MEGTIGNMRPSPLHFSRSLNRNQSRNSSQDRTESAINRSQKSSYDPNDDDNVSLHSYATGLYYNDNLSQLSQADFDELSSDDSLYLGSSGSDDESQE